MPTARRTPHVGRLVYDPLGKVVLDPNEQVQHRLRLLYETFTRVGSASATVRHFNKENLNFPYRPAGGAHKGELHWNSLTHSRVVRIPLKPRFADAFVFGRSRKRRRSGGGVERNRVPRGEWMVLLPETHPGYITWQRFEENERQLRANARSHASEDRRPNRPADEM